MVTAPRGPREWKEEEPAALQRADIDAWIYPVEGITLEAELREEFLDWASKRPAGVRWIRDGTSLFRVYQLAYERDSKFPGWSKEKSLQMLRSTHLTMTAEEGWQNLG